MSIEATEAVALRALPQVSARAFAPRPDKKGQEAGEVGIEGTTIEEAEPVSSKQWTACPFDCRC